MGPAPSAAPGTDPTWERAWDEALYGPRGFYRRPEGPAGHFRTASHAAAGLLAEALVGLARDTGCTDVVYVGARRGELLGALAATGAALGLHGIDVVDRPRGLPERVGWSVGAGTLPRVTSTRRGQGGVLVLAWELLDVVPCPVLEADEDRLLRVVHVDPRTGVESLGDPATEADLGWCRGWWPPEGADTSGRGGTGTGTVPRAEEDPGYEAGTRVEVGRPRDAVWAGLVGAVARTGPGVLLAVDYAHLGSPADGTPSRGARDRTGSGSAPVAVVSDTARDLLRGRPGHGSLSAFRSGRMVPPLPDGGCDLTAHVALDAVAAAGTSAGAAATLITTQREALLALGLRGSPGTRTTTPVTANSTPAATESRDPAPALLTRLTRGGEVAELIDPGGLGGFGWLVQTVGMPLPGSLLPGLP